MILNNSSQRALVEGEFKDLITVTMTVTITVTVLVTGIITESLLLLSTSPSLLFSSSSGMLIEGPCAISAIQKCGCLECVQQHQEDLPTG